MKMQLLLQPPLSSTPPPSSPSPSSSPSTSRSISRFISQHRCLSLLETSCSNMCDLKILHAELVKTGLAADPIAVSRLLFFCATSPSGDLRYALQLLRHHHRHPTLFSYNTILRALSRSSAPEIAISAFVQMLLHSPLLPNRLTYPSLFRSYARLGAAHRGGAQLHARVLKLGLQSDRHVLNSLISMYASCGHSASARFLFDDGDVTPDVVAWNSMVLGLARNGEIDAARKLFDEMPMRTAITWNSMISGCVGNGRNNEALELFHLMQSERVEPSEFTMASLLSACANLGALERGEWVHAFIEKNGLEVNVILLTAIIDMYCKCGCVEKALQVFNDAPIKGLSSWNSLIFGLAINGCGEEAIRVFTRLESSSSGLRPDDVSFLGILTVCNHCGMVDEGRRYFSVMIDTYGIQPTIKHYGCMVDLLGRAGSLEEAEEVIASMPFDADDVIWGCLLCGCRNYGDVERGKRVAKRMIELNVQESSAYVMLSNVYAAAGRFEDAMRVRKMMREREVWKDPGSSMVEVDGVVHEFVVDGKLHSQIRDVHHVLYELGLMLKESGRVKLEWIDLFD